MKMCFSEIKMIQLTLTTNDNTQALSIYPDVFYDICTVSSLKDIWSMANRKVSLSMCVDSYRMLVQTFINIW